MRWLWLKWVHWCGVAANLAEGIDVSVKVHRSPLYTIITVNGIDVYFYRLTGGIDGVGR